MFDKDNTLTAPFAATVEPRLIESLGACQRTFGAGGVVLYSNSAGLKQYDPEGKKLPGRMCLRILPCKTVFPQHWPDRLHTIRCGHLAQFRSYVPYASHFLLFPGEEADALEAALGIHVLR